MRSRFESCGTIGIRRTGARQRGRELRRMGLTQRAARELEVAEREMRSRRGRIGRRRSRMRSEGRSVRLGPGVLIDLAVAIMVP